MPGEEVVPPAVRKLLRETIDSIEKIEILVALVRDPAPTTAAALATNLSLSPASIHEAVTELVRDGVIHRPGQDGQISYNSSHPAASIARALVALYLEDRVLVLRLLSSLALERVRGDAARLLADAFVIMRRKKGDDDG